MVVNFNREDYNAGLLLPTKLEKLTEGYQIGPPWLRPLLTAKFFETCEVHGDNNRNERNLYCLDCRGEALCSGCTAQHRDHHVVQIRRSSYHDVVRVSELQKVLDLAGVQTYIINSAKVVFLNARPQPRHAKGVTKTCEICDRSLLDTNRYCSLGCKLTGIRRHNDMTFHLTPKNEQHQQQQATNNASQTPAITPTEPAPAPSPAAQDEIMDQHLPPAMPAGSSLTSEDVSVSNSGSSAAKIRNNSGSRKRSSGSSSSSKRTRSSRKASGSPVKTRTRSHEIDESSHDHNTVNESSDREQNHLKIAEEEAPKIDMTTLMDLDDMALTTSLVQKSLGTLKLGRRSSPGNHHSRVSSDSPQSTMELELASGCSPTAASCCSLMPASATGGVNTSEFSPSTPPPTRTSKRRKGTPHRAPFGM